MANPPNLLPFFLAVLALGLKMQVGFEESVQGLLRSYIIGTITKRAFHPHSNHWPQRCENPLGEGAGLWRESNPQKSTIPAQRVLEWVICD